jgi:PIN domain nuclease of toxin-antitoxin system
MKILLDTCSFLLFVNGEVNKISKIAKSIFLDGESEIFLSIVSCWEISIKWSINKL